MQQRHNLNAKSGNEIGAFVPMSNPSKTTWAEQLFIMALNTTTKTWLFALG